MDDGDAGVVSSADQMYMARSALRADVEPAGAGRARISAPSVLPDPPAHAVRREFTASDLAELRLFITLFVGNLALRRSNMHDVVAVGNELAANSVAHAGGHGTMSLWCTDADLVLDVRDRGHFDDRGAGHLLPSLLEAGGRGLWMVNHLADLVQIRSSASEGTQVRAHFQIR